MGKTYAGKEFIHFLISKNLLQEIHEDDALPQDLILYFNHGEFRHVGRLIEPSRIISKWGTGHLYEHAFWEIPESYGDKISFFKGPDSEECLELFGRYAESRGFVRA